ncbi:MAG: hypothetical protein AB7L91_18290 [Dehalococcoidia bacterium]
MTPKPRPRTPAEFLQQLLPEPEIGAAELEQDDDLRTVELGRSVLAITELTHESELTAVLDTVKRATGDPGQASEERRV